MSSFDVEAQEHFTKFITVLLQNLITFRQAFVLPLWSAQAALFMLASYCYNLHLSLSLSMKCSYMFISLTCPEPKSPKKNIDIFLQSLIEDLKHLWKLGAYDVHTCQKFNMRAALRWLSHTQSIHTYCGIVKKCNHFTSMFSVICAL